MSATTAPAETDPDDRYVRGSRQYRRVVLAMFASGVATFALLHNPQAVLPLLSDAFDTTPAGASLAISVATGGLAIGVIPISALSERFGRVRIMTIALVVSTALGVLTPLSPTYHLLLAARALQGLALAGLPAVAVAYLAEEIHPRSLAGSVGTLIGGNAIGGLAGRLLAGVVADLAGWKAGMAAVGGMSLVFCLVAVGLLPRQRHFRPVPVDFARLVASVRRHLSDSRLLRLYGAGCVLMGSFSTLYNYLGYRLLAPPFSMTPAVVGLVFLAYLAGTAASATAGRLAETVGPRTVLVCAALLSMVAAIVTLPDRLPVILVGVVAQTIGFFAGHSVASGWVGRLATTARAQAAALYTLAYYVGASVGGWAGGLAYQRSGWLGTVAYLMILLALTAVAGVSMRPRRLPRDRHQVEVRGPSGAAREEQRVRPGAEIDGYCR